jgi:hypothetical protein
MRYLDFFEQAAAAALVDDDAFDVVCALIGGQVEYSWQTWQVIGARLIEERREHQRYAWATGGLGEWLRFRRLDRDAWGPRDLPFDTFTSFVDSLAVITSLHRD